MKPHRFDIISFVFGAIFLVFTVSAVWNTDLNFSLSVWVLPAAALILGIGLLASTLRSGNPESVDDD
ncbi:MAG: hypothetical protein BMS9Abin17_0887 [Acidimicrobiia bacterium]|nr:MAG: hypothetical protein BMS9Abin17_0887 [Acidimicrobiia bacterium]